MMLAELVNLATSEKLKEPDWSKNIEICEAATHDQRQAKDVIKSLKKRLNSKNMPSQIFSVVLLEMLMNNCGEHIHRLIIETGVLQLMVKIVKKKSDAPVREKIFLLLDAAQTALGGASGKFPQYYAAYYDLVRARVQFPRDSALPSSNLPPPQTESKDLPLATAIPQKCDPDTQPPKSQIIPDLSIIEKAATVMEVLREVLDAIDPSHPEGATDEFTLDLVEQCSFQKQRMIHLVMSSRDEKLVSQAIELNDQMQKLLTKHDRLLSVPNASSIAVNHEGTKEDEEADHLFLRARKGKPHADTWTDDRSEGSSSSSDSGAFEMPRRPINTNWSHLRISPQETPPIQAPTVIPPPPAKYKERQLFFMEKQTVGSGTIDQSLNGVSLHSRNASSSQSGSTEFSE